jgi:TRAP-type uncharacterized transport system fused permease subunit
VVTAILGIFGVAAGIGGYIFKNMNPLFRLLIIGGGLTLLIPGVLTDIIGVALVAFVCVADFLSAKRLKAA